MPRRMADPLTGEIANSIPRPRGRSGCVTTSGTECPPSTSFSRVGTAKRGVPQKTKIISVRYSISGVRKNKIECASPVSGFLKPDTCDLKLAPLPFSRFHQFLDPALNQVAFERANVRNVEFAVQVIGFM